MSLSPESVAAANRLLHEHRRILVIPHANVDPDGLGSALACYHVFRAMGKDVTVICPDTPPESLKFLPGFPDLQQEIADRQQFIITVNLEEGVEIDTLRYTVEEKKVNIIVVPKRGAITPQQVSLAPGERPYDLIVVVDTADLALLGSLARDHMDLFTQVPVLNIDHHVSNTGFGQLQLMDPTAASATEVLYQWFLQVPAMRDAITPDIATLLLTGLITDTRSFQNPNTTPRSLEVAAELLERGARQQEIVQHIYKTKPLSTLKIWGRALHGIQIDRDARIVWSSISKEDLAEMGATSKETHGILDELISTIPDADVHVLFTEKEDGGLKASLRSAPTIDASRLAGEAYGGGGHPRAAGFSVPSFANFSLQVLECVQTLKEGMKRQRTEGDTEGRNGGVNKEKPAPVPVQEMQQQEPIPPPAPVRQTDVLQGLNPQQQSSPGTDVVDELTGKENDAPGPKH